jgi:hypothetical protein
MIKKRELGMLIALMKKNMLNLIDVINYYEILNNKDNQFNEIVVTQTSFMVKNLFDKRIKHIK